jgi:hypothetical protein
MSGRPWPDLLAESALHGIGGDIVRAIEPHTEADPVGILVDLLCMFGSMVGQGPYYQVESTRHHANIFAIIVGKTSRSRKGTAFDRAYDVARTADETWATTRLLSGLASGEGLIHAVRDAREPVNDTDPGDPGVNDKRLLARESEFASVIQKGKREGNVLTAVLRDAWDGRILANLTKNNAERSTNAHMSMIGEITEEELLRIFDQVNIANGFGNRCLWVSVKRSKELPDGGSVDEAIRGRLSAGVALAAEEASARERVQFDDSARAMWRDTYSSLTREVPGILGALTGRAEAQVVRLALIYALLDRAATIGVEHLEAALAVWRYCEKSVIYIFGDALGDPTADAILGALRRRSPEGMSRTDISALFGRNVNAQEIDRALKLLQELGRVKADTEGSGRPGRKPEVWSLC